MAQRFRPVPANSYVSSPFGPRWGTIHYGTDFGRAGGAADMPVFAAQGGTVVYAGAASGFGGPDPAGWVVLDHPTADGAGTTVYGHIIRDDYIRPGVRVEAGQRIGRVNPNQATNGGVAPHLHFEVHPTVWRPRSQVDPVKWLGDAPSPGGASLQVDPAPEGVIFGVDVSEHQDGMSLKRAAAEGVKFAIIRTTDGTYKDRVYQSHLDDAESAGLITAAYHYLRNPNEGTSVRQQVDAALQVMGDKKRPIWLDVETPAGLHVDHLREAKRLFEQAGVRVIGLYSYVPYFEHQVAPAEPDSHEFGAFWVAAYGMNPAGLPADLYARANKRQWDYPLGNQRPALWQFGSKAAVAGYHVDINAFRGDVGGIRALFNGAPDVVDNDAKTKVDIADQVTLPPTARPVVPVPEPYVGKHRADTTPPGADHPDTEPAAPVDVKVEETTVVPVTGVSVDTLVSKIVDALIDAIVSIFMGKKGK